MATIEEGELPTSAEVDERRRAARGDAKARRRVESVDRSVGVPVRRVEEEAVAEVQAGADVAPAAAEEAAPAEKRRRGRKQPAEASLSGLLRQTEEPTTEAERVQRRYALRDARKRIGWVDAGEALKEASRIEHEERVGVAHAAALEGEAAVSDRATFAQDASSRSSAEDARRADVLARLREAEAAISAEREARQRAGLPEETPAAASVEAPVSVTRSAEAVEAAAAQLIEPAEEARLRRAMELRARVSNLVAGLDLNDLADYEAILSRLEHDHDLRRITAALIKALAGGEVAGGGVSAFGAPASEVEKEEEVTVAAGNGEGRAADGDEMTRLFISIGRRARVNREALERLVREAAQLEEDDIGRIDLLHNFAFIEVRKAVAGRVIEGMHETMFKGREISVEPAKSSAKDE